MTEVPLYRILNPATPPPPHLAAHNPSYLTLLAHSSPANTPTSTVQNPPPPVPKDVSTAPRHHLPLLLVLPSPPHNVYTPFHAFLEVPLTPSATPLAHQLPRFHHIPQYAVPPTQTTMSAVTVKPESGVPARPRQTHSPESSPPLPSKDASVNASANANANTSNATSAQRNLLSTSSPEGIHVASQITPTRLANLLIRKGPLPIRHITSQLALEVTNFTNLSLSKQRRLIMAAMDQVDPENNVVFEKIGWGQWAVRKVDSDFIVTEGTESAGAGASDAYTNDAAGAGEGNGESRPPLNVHDLRNQTNLKLGWSKKQNVTSEPNTNGRASTRKLTGARKSAEKFRRESITYKNKLKNLHNLRPPKDLKEDMAIASDLEEEDENALADFDEDDEIEHDDEEDDDDEEEEEEELAILSHAVSSDSELSSGLDVELPPKLVLTSATNAVVDEDVIVDDDEKAMLAVNVRSTIQQPFHVRANSTNSITSRRYSNSKRMSPPIRFAKRVPMKTSPPPQQHGSFSSASRRRSSSSNSQIGKVSATPRHQIFSRSRLNSLDNLDNYILSSAKNSQVLINSPPPLSSNNGTIPMNVAMPLNLAPSYSASSNGTIPQGTQSFVISPPQDGYLSNRRKSSFNESHLRLTITSSPKPASASPNILPARHDEMQVDDVDTEDEDWERIGAEKLRQQEALKAEQSKNGAGQQNTVTLPSAEPVNISPNHSHASASPSAKDPTRLTFHATAEDERAAFALVDMMSV